MKITDPQVVSFTPNTNKTSYVRIFYSHLYHFRIRIIYLDSTKFFALSIRSAFISNRFIDDVLTVNDVYIYVIQAYCWNRNVHRAHSHMNENARNSHKVYIRCLNSKYIGQAYVQILHAQSKSQRSRAILWLECKRWHFDTHTRKHRHTHTQAYTQWIVGILAFLFVEMEFESFLQRASCHMR